MIIANDILLPVQVDYLVNNAGRSQRAADIDTQLEVIRLLLETNTIGTISLTKALMPHMIKQQKGCVVFISSIAGKLGKYLLMSL